MTTRSRLAAAPDPMHLIAGSDGLRITADSWGEQQGPLVLLQHGRGQTRHAWKNAGIRLGDAGYRTVAFDARGHGDSDWDPAGEYGPDALVDDLLSVMTWVGDEHPILVGASMGGATSLLAVGEGRVEAKALVLVDVGTRIDVGGMDRIGTFMAQGPDGFASLDEVADAIAAYQPHRKRARNLDGLAKNVRIGEDGRYYWHWDPQIRNRTIDLEARNRRMDAAARNLELPVLLVRGGLSDVLTEEGARTFLELCPQAEYVNVPGAAHMVAGDRNDVFAGAVIDFLQRAVPVLT